MALLVMAFYKNDEHLTLHRRPVKAALRHPPPPLIAAT
jgi:hypothetical protein